MPIPTDRPSLNTDLETRYKTQHAGGAFDAKGPQPDVLGIQEKTWTKKGFGNAGDEGLGLAGTKTYDKSLMLQGFNNKKYKG